LSENWFEKVKIFKYWLRPSISMNKKNIIISILILTLTLFLVSCEEQNQELLDRISQLENSNNNLQSQVSSLNQQLNNLQNSLETKDEELDAISEDLKAENKCLIDNYEIFGNDETLYAQGSLIVGFVNGTTESEAESTASEFGLDVQRLGPIFDEHPWATFNVPIGKEIEWSCKIVSHEKVNNANVNLLTTSAQ